MLAEYWQRALARLVLHYKFDRSSLFCCKSQIINSCDRVKVELVDSAIKQPSTQTAWFTWVLFEAYRDWDPYPLTAKPPKNTTYTASVYKEIIYNVNTTSDILSNMSDVHSQRTPSTMLNICIHNDQFNVITATQIWNRQAEDMLRFGTKVLRENLTMRAGIYKSWKSMPNCLQVIHVRMKTNSLL